MKKFTTLWLVLAMLCTFFSSIAQTNKPVPIGVFVAKTTNEGRLEYFPNKPAFVHIQIKYKDGNLAYAETHSANLSEFSSLDVSVGTGAPLPTFDFNAVDFSRVSTYCFDIVVTTDQGSVAIPTIMENFGAVPSANHALNADNANGLGGHPTETSWNTNYYEELKNPESGSYFITTNDENEHIMQPYYYRDIQQYHAGTSHVTGNAMDLWELNILKSGSVVLRTAPGSTPGPVKNLVEICAEDLNEFLHGLGIIIKNPTRGSVPHTTAAIYGENINDPLGIGVFANGGARGSFNQGQTGAFGHTVGEGNGAGLWGYVGSAPAAGGYKYAMVGDNQGLANTYAAAVFGDGFYTGTWSMVSDARLKTGVRSQINALEQISKLKPSQYHYISDSPYRLPDGIHYGFLAQEVEAILPELVEDVIVPKNMDPEKMATSGTETYKAVNYTELIPLLTAALQELNHKVNDLVAANEILKKELKACKPK